MVKSNNKETSFCRIVSSTKHVHHIFGDLECATANRFTCLESYLKFIVKKRSDNYNNRVLVTETKTNKYSRTELTLASPKEQNI